MRRIAVIVIAAVIAGVVVGIVIASSGDDSPSQDVTAPELRPLPGRSSGSERESDPRSDARGDEATTGRAPAPQLTPPGGSSGTETAPEAGGGEEPTGGTAPDQEPETGRQQPGSETGGTQAPPLNP